MLVVVHASHKEEKRSLLYILAQLGPNSAQLGPNSAQLDPRTQRVLDLTTREKHRSVQAAWGGGRRGADLPPAAQIRGR